VQQSCVASGKKSYQVQHLSLLRPGACLHTMRLASGKDETFSSGISEKALQDLHGFT